MEYEVKDINKILVIGSLVILGLLVFFLLKPVLVSVVAGLILAYIFMPLYNWLVSRLRSKNLSASIVLFFLLAIVVIPIWFLVPILVNQIFEIFQLTQSLDIVSFTRSLFPTASDTFLAQISATTSSIISKLSSSTLNLIVNVFLEAPTLLLHMFIIGFVFFVGLRDSAKMKEMAKELSPFNKSKEKILVKQFRDITDSLVYGQIIVGVVQGLLAGLGMLIFGIDNALLLTILAMLFAIIPTLGPYVVYIPVTLILLSTGNTTIAIAYLAYNLLIVSTLDNVLRTYIVSRRTKMNSAIVFVGMMAGLFMFGIIGLLLGPLIISYFLVLLQLYKEKALHSLFTKEEELQEAK